jgi:radical SAM superfamily enzyme YgiQ (UPF0313 family)
VNLADDDALLADMREAGFHRVFLGIETPVEESLIETQKTQNTKRSLLESVAKLQSYGLEVMAGFIVGFDNDPENIFQLQIDFIRDSAIPLAMVGMLTPLPATQLWRRLEKEGRLISDGTGSNMDGLNFVPVMAPNRLTEGYRSIMETIYESREYYARALECLRRLPATGRPEPSSFTIVHGAVTLGRILLTLGVLEPERGEFWRYMYRAFTQHRSRFVQAVRLAAMGYHFRKLKVARHAPTAAVADAPTGEIVFE